MQKFRMYCLYEFTSTIGKSINHLVLSISCLVVTDNKGVLNNPDPQIIEG